MKMILKINKHNLIFTSNFNHISSLELETNKYKEVDELLNFCKKIFKYNIKIINA